MSIGNNLKQAREEQGLSLNEIEDKTKIRIRYLKALEDDSYDLIPGEVYVKAFIKGYARQVGLDGNKLAREYQHLLKEQAMIKNEELKTKEGIDHKNGIFFQNRLINTLIIIIILIVLAIVIYNVFLLNNSQNELQGLSKDNFELKQVNEITELKENLNEITEEEKESEIDFKNDLIKIIATERSWLQINIDGKEVFQGFMDQDEIKEITCSKELILKIGNGAGIKIIKDNKVLGPWGERGEVIKKEFKF